LSLIRLLHNVFRPYILRARLDTARCLLRRHFVSSPRHRGGRSECHTVESARMSYIPALPPDRSHARQREVTAASNTPARRPSPRLGGMPASFRSINSWHATATAVEMQR